MMTPPNYRWLGFELSVLRRLKFQSVVVPFAGEPSLELSLKRWGAQVATNDVFHWAWTKSTALVGNNDARLSESDLEIVLEDAYAPRHLWGNPSLLRWFDEPDAWWFDNVRENLERLESPVKQALALTLGMAVGDYVFSFDRETREYRLPLSRVYRRLWAAHAPPIDNRRHNRCTHSATHEFLAEQNADLLFLRLPHSRTPATQMRRSFFAWREEWVRGDDAFWPALEAADADHLGSSFETKHQYFSFVRELLERCAHLPAWAITHTDHGVVSSDELVETIRGVRRVETIYTKDFSELTGARASIITAV